MRGVVVATAFIAMAFAGCSGQGNGAAAEPTVEPIAFEDLTVTESKGLIRGLVLSETITPIQGATVSLISEAKTLVTDEQGAFVFNELEPGDYFLSVSKVGYLSIQASATVVAGVAEPQIVKVQLVVDKAAATLYTVLQKWDGFLQCGFTVVVLGFNACGLIDDRFINNFDMSALPTFVQGEMVWKSTQTLSPDLNLGFYEGGVTNWNSVEGPSPQVTNTTGEEILDHRGNESTVLPMRVFPPYTLPVGMTLEQQFTVFVTMTYGFTPRAGWLFIEEGPCEPYTACA
jgi:hypothetical protein